MTAVRTTVRNVRPKKGSSLPQHHDHYVTYGRCAGAVVCTLVRQPPLLLLLLQLVAARCPRWPGPVMPLLVPYCTPACTLLCHKCDAAATGWPGLRYGVLAWPPPDPRYLPPDCEW